VSSAARLRRFDAYLDELHCVLGDQRRHEHFDAYCRGLNLGLERKSVEPIAAAIDPHNVSARHQSLLHFVAEAPWSDRALLDRIGALVDEAMDEAPRYWLLDDTACPKKGVHSVGVGRQWCGQLGKTENCQSAVSLSLASEQASVPIDHRLYLPARWTNDVERCRAAGVPEQIEFATKPEITLELIRAAINRTGSRPAALVADAGYGDVTSFREGLEELGLVYSLGVKPPTKVWAPGVEPLPPKRWSGRGRRPSKMVLAPGHEPVTVESLARSLDARKWRTISWREGANATLSGRFARVRVRAAHDDANRVERRSEQWLIIEWPGGDSEPSGYFLSNEPASVTLADLVRTIKIRWRIERDYQELKSEFGLGHYEGRGWRGFHHHASLCIATYAFHVLERLAGKSKKKDAARPTPPAVPEGWTPRGSPGANATSRA